PIDRTRQRRRRCASCGRRRNAGKAPVARGGTGQLAAREDGNSTGNLHFSGNPVGHLASSYDKADDGISNGALIRAGAGWGDGVMRRLLLSLACAWLALDLAACDTVRDAAVVASVAPS